MAGTGRACFLLGVGAAAGALLLLARVGVPATLNGAPTPAGGLPPPPHPLEWRDLEKKRSRHGAGRGKSTGGKSGGGGGGASAGISSSCSKCIDRKCYTGAKCPAAWGFSDPKGTERAFCMCACCGLQCGLKRGCPVRPSEPPTPEIPLAQIVANMTGDDDERPLDGVRAITFTEWRGSTFAITISTLNSALHVANVDEPARPVLVGGVSHGQRGFRMRAPAGLHALEIRGTPHALVTSFADDGLQVVRLDPPSEPRALAWAQDGREGFQMLEGAHSVVGAPSIAGRAHAFVSAYRGGGVQVIDIESAAAPRPVAAMRLDGGPQALALERLVG
eukprot:CAMPEP_0119407224 /NCGR_PEP_ID=MMETSP1335-20130426/1208_1 /TAXON_ID=259385 /ORGANISM="Chrysoculter rhomboideus, Strain RCC1486" /LENGTH=332 /DNA_ID=CAMNT_0007431319 /DNA_START=26 /DNA_END=1020 /DNA_ORIENTATION=+